MMDRRLIRLASEPVRLQALTFLNEHAAGVSEVAAKLEIDPAEAGRHLDALYYEGLIEVVGEVLNRGAVEPHYRALVRSLFDDEEWAMIGLDEQKRLTGWVLGMIETDAREALASGTLTARPDAHVSRTTPTVDEQGWEEIRRILDDALQLVFAAEAAAAERLAENGEDGFPALTALLCCELPRRSAPSSS
jgi:DNA-binding transcriptional ArsR family regulator